jgi:hypothetical protein
MGYVICIFDVQIPIPRRWEPSWLQTLDDQIKVALVSYMIKITSYHRGINVMSS